MENSLLHSLPLTLAYESWFIKGFELCTWTVEIVIYRVGQLQVQEAITVPASNTRTNSMAPTFTSTIEEETEGETPLWANSTKASAIPVVF